MPLLDEAFESFRRVIKTRTDDGRGGSSNVWTESDTIECALVLNNSIDGRVALAQGVTAVYTITTRKSITLNYHDVLKRVSDGRYFRVTSDGNDNRTPASAALNMRQVSAEEWHLDG